MTGTHTHQELIQFMVLYRKLRDMIDDDPSRVESLAVDNDAVKKLCLQIENSALGLKLAEQRHRQLFAAPVDAKFIEAWRDYEERFSIPLGNIFWSDLGLNFEPSANARTTKLEAHWEYAAALARDRAKAIESALDFAQEQTSQEWRDFPEGFAEDIQAGITDWRRLTTETGFDLEAVFLRRELVPFILIPKHISDHHGSEEALSLLTHLQQAHEAFVFGVPFAAITLMRSILEVVLKKHYGSIGQNLEILIDNADLPRSVAKANLHRIRTLANDILHFKRERVRMPRNLDEEILSLLHTLRALIEQKRP